MRTVFPPNFDRNPHLFGGCQKGGFPKGWFIRMFPRNENRNEGTFACSPGTKTGTRVRSHVSPERKTSMARLPNPPFYETALCLLSVYVKIAIPYWPTQPREACACDTYFGIRPTTPGQRIKEQYLLRSVKNLKILDAAI